MNLWLLVWNYLVARPLNTILNIFLLALGVAVVTLLIIGNHQLHDKITANAKGIDLVVGAKGSPMQLILCNIFHVDFPTGNISLPEAERIAGNRLVKKAIPLALGDSYGGYRIVGTTQAYAQLYGAQLKSGKEASRVMEVTVGASVADRLQLSVGEQFESNHGLSRAGQAHDEGEFVVAGVYETTNSVLDNLILTSIESIWRVHEGHTSDTAISTQHHGSIASPLIPSVSKGDSTREITSLLIQYRSAMGAIQLPRWVNGQSRLQAAAPAFETARLFSILGVGVDILKAFASVLILISILSIFIALYNALKERQYDMAVMRSMGASRTKIFLTVIMEGMALTSAGACVGLFLAHGVLAGFASVVEEAQQSGISGFIFYPEEGIILAAGLLTGVLCAVIPALQAYRTDISKVLASA